MYDIIIITYIWLICIVNVGKYTIHGSYGHWLFNRDPYVMVLWNESPHNWFGSSVFIAHLSLEVQGPFKKNRFSPKTMLFRREFESSKIQPRLCFFVGNLNHPKLRTIILAAIVIVGFTNQRYDWFMTGSSWHSKTSKYISPKKKGVFLLGIFKGGSSHTFENRWPLDV